jgi:hypothetical protein
MSDLHPCVYCATLPTAARTRATRVARCPLCKTELGTAGGGGRFRIVAGDAPRRRHRLALFLAAGGAAACLLIFVPVILRSMHAAVPAESPPQPTVGQLLPPVVHPEEIATAESEPKAAAVPAAVPVAAPAAPEPPHAVAKAADGLDWFSPVRPALKNGTTPRAAHGPLPAVGVYLSESSPVAQLLRVPEVSLEPVATDRLPREQAKKKLAEFAAHITQVNRGQTDGFIRSLVAERRDLAGLPFRLDSACRLPDDGARTLGDASAATRSALASAAKIDRTQQPGLYPSALPHVRAAHFGSALWRTPSFRVHRVSASLPTLADWLPGLAQVLAGVEGPYRIELINLLHGERDERATRAVTRLAIYDPEPAVRRRAAEELRHRPKEPTGQLLLDALRHPWVPAARQAANLIVALERDDLLARLVELLDEPDPCAPFTVEKEARSVTLVREVVRVNHHRNCLLCHAPADRNVRVARGLLAQVPSPSEPLPPSTSTVYYGAPPGVTVVRADVTYLRQDFSALLPVADSAPWPEVQRFDFFVRTREVGKKDTSRAGMPSEHRDAILFALRGLTGGRDGSTAADWRRILATPAPEPAPGRWRIDCRK